MDNGDSVEAEQLLAKRRVERIATCPACANQCVAAWSTLPCLHNYCTACIADWASDDPVYCLRCGSQLDVLNAGQFPRNAFTDKLVLIEVLSRPANERGPCDSCSSSSSSNGRSTATCEGDANRPTSVVFCVECRQKLCAGCEAVHRTLSASRRHRTVVLGEQWTREDSRTLDVDCSLPPGGGCVIHVSRQAAERYDGADCSLTNVCYARSSANSYEHWRSNDDDTFADDARRMLLEDVRRLSDGLERSRATIRAVDREKERLTENAEKCAEDVRRTAEQLRRLIDAHERAVVLELDCIVENELKRLVNASLEIQHLVSVVEDLKLHAEAVVDVGSAGDLARWSCALHDRVDGLIGVGSELLDVDSVSVGFSPSTLLDDWDDNVVGTVDRMACVVAPEAEVQPEQSTMREVAAARRPVRGLATLDGRLYVVRCPSEHQIEVYDAASFLFERYLSVCCLGDVTFGLASCAVDRAIYVSDASHNAVHRIQLQHQQQQQMLSKDDAESDGPTGAATLYITSCWQVDGYPTGISVITGCRQIIVVCCGKPNKLKRYSSLGAFLGDVCLPADIVRPWHAVRMPTGSDDNGERYAVCHGAVTVSGPVGLHRVCVVGEDGRILASYGGSAGHSVGQLSAPRCLAVSDTDDRVLVADTGNNRIVQLDGSMKLIGELNLPLQPGDQLVGPWAITLDQSRDSRLFVGEFEGGRVLVFNAIVY